MAVRIRLQRHGRRKRPFYRIVVMDSKTRRDGREIERVGWYNPVQIDNQYEIKSERIFHWLKEGAQPSDTVNNLFKKAGINYKWHMIQSGKSEEEIEAAMTEWHIAQDSRKQEAAAAAQPKEQEAKTEEVEETATPLEAETTDTSEEELADTEDGKSA